jgi:hypothetical protein
MIKQTIYDLAENHGAKTPVARGESPVPVGFGWPVAPNVCCLLYRGSLHRRDDNASEDNLLAGQEDEQGRD